MTWTPHDSALVAWAAASIALVVVLFPRALAIPGGALPGWRIAATFGGRPTVRDREVRRTS
jgi:hypothetical protein